MKIVCPSPGGYSNANPKDWRKRRVLASFCNSNKPFLHLLYQNEGTMSIATLSTLEQADFTVKQARVLTRVLEEDHQNLATKDDFKSIKKDIKFLEAKMATKEETQSIRGEIKSTKEEIKFLEARMATKEETQSIREDIKDIRGDIKSLEAKMAADIKFLEAKMATKGETQSIREDIKDIRGDIKSLEAKMVTKTELNKTSNYLIRWIVTGMFFNIGILYVLLKYFGQP